MTANPMVTLNRAVATAMVNGPRAGLALADGLGVRLGDHHRLHAVRAHLPEQRVPSRPPPTSPARLPPAPATSGNAITRPPMRPVSLRNPALRAN
jgi:hypothetical protein